MKYQVEKTFTHNGQDYEIRSCTSNGSVHVKAYKQDGTPADGYSFCVTIETQCDAEATKSVVDPIAALVTTAEEYVRVDRHKQILQASKALEQKGL